MGSSARAAAPRPAAGLRTTWAWIRGFHYKHRGPIQQRIGPRGSRAGGAGTAPVDYERVTVYWPHAVNWIVTVVAAVPLVTMAVSFPESNRGSTVQLPL